MNAALLVNVVWFTSAARTTVKKSSKQTKRVTQDTTDVTKLEVDKIPQDPYYKDFGVAAWFAIVAAGNMQRHANAKRDHRVREHWDKLLYAGKDMEEAQAKGILSHVRKTKLFHLMELWRSPIITVGEFQEQLTKYNVNTKSKSDPTAHVVLQPHLSDFKGLALQAFMKDSITNSIRQSSLAPVFEKAVASAFAVTQRFESDTKAACGGDDSCFYKKLDEAEEKSSNLLQAANYDLGTADPPHPAEGSSFVNTSAETLRQSANQTGMTASCRYYAQNGRTCCHLHPAEKDVAWVVTVLSSLTILGLCCTDLTWCSWYPCTCYCDWMYC